MGAALPLVMRSGGDRRDDRGHGRDRAWAWGVPTAGIVAVGAEFECGMWLGHV
jgi:hypothetical protein